MKTLVYGLGESGLKAVKALRGTGAVVAADAEDSATLRSNLENLGVEGHLNATSAVLEGVERVVASPGVRPSDPVLAAAEERGIPVVSEVGLGLELLGGVPTVAVTGTNGKTTVVDMIHHLLERSDVPHTVAGNSWRALTGCLDEARESGLLVLEVSSFQLHYMDEPGFEVAAVLNVRPDHLNWHASFEEYAGDKKRIFSGQDSEDLALVGARDPIGATAITNSEKIVIGRGDTGVVDGRLVLAGTPLVETDELPFAGGHNHENALFAAAAIRRSGVSPEAIGEALKSYRLKPHRMQKVAERDGVFYIDDSKATNPAAVAAALAGSGRPVVLILGGSEKETDFAEVLPTLDRCRAVVCQGESGPRLAEFLRERWDGGRVMLTPDLASAVEAARGLARRGDMVLLSPGCASFDQHSGYAERGEVFARLVHSTGGGVALGGDAVAR